MKISIAILAGGKSSRMGKNKALLPFGDKTFLDKLIEELRVQGDIIVSVDDKRKYRGCGYRLVEDEHKGIGPIEGIYQVLSNVDVEYAFVCATDMPYIKSEVVEGLKANINGEYLCYIIKDGEKVHPLCGIYSKKIIPVLKELILQEEYKLMKIFERVPTKYIQVDDMGVDGKNLININTIEDYRKVIEQGKGDGE